MTEIEIKQLQTEKRFSTAGLKTFYLLLYLPIGLVILLVRIALGLVAILLGNILPEQVFGTKNVLSQLFRAICGVVVHTEKSVNKESNVKVIISNNISPLDHFVLHIATGCILSHQTSLPTPISSSLGLKNFGNASNLDEVKKTLNAHLLNTNLTRPILFQPETKITNGRAVLKFKEWPFSLAADEVQPVCLKVRRPVFDIAVTTITSSYWSDIFWYLFTPWTIYQLTYLPVIKRSDTADLDFAEKVRQAIAAELQVEACSYNAADVLEWEKRYLLEQRRARMVHNSPSNTSLHSNNPELHRMARQVKEVLPTVPYNVIFKDLARTKNVDLTISNILEGHIPYTPELPTATTTPASVEHTTTSTPPGGGLASTSTTYQHLVVRKEKDSLCTAASSFPKSAHDRMQSFQERKLQLIMNARKRYMDKHGLDALASNNC